MGLKETLGAKAAAAAAEKKGLENVLRMKAADHARQQIEGEMAQDATRMQQIDSEIEQVQKHLLELGLLQQRFVDATDEVNQARNDVRKIIEGDRDTKGIQSFFSEPEIARYLETQEVDEVVHQEQIPVEKLKSFFRAEESFKEAGARATNTGRKVPITTARHLIDSQGIVDEEPEIVQVRGLEEKVSDKQKVVPEKFSERQERKLQIASEADAPSAGYAGLVSFLRDKLQKLEAERKNIENGIAEKKVDLIDTVAERFTDLSSIDIGMTENEDVFKLKVGDSSKEMVFSKTGTYTYAAASSVLSEGVLLPKNFKEIADQYGQEIAENALQRAYENKVKRVFLDFEKKAIKPVVDALENMSGKKMNEVQGALNAYDDLRQNVLRALQTKERDFLKQNISFDPEYTGRYGVSYEEITTFAGSTVDTIIRHFLKGSDVEFPPQYDLSILEQKIKEQTEKLRTFLNTVNALSNEADIKKFISTESLSLLRTDINSFNLNDVRLDYQAMMGKLGEMGRKMFRPFSDRQDNKRRGVGYEHAKAYIEKKSDLLQYAGDKIAARAGLAILLRKAEFALSDIALKHDMDSYSLPGVDSEIRRGQESAASMLSQWPSIMGKFQSILDTKATFAQNRLTLVSDDTVKEWEKSMRDKKNEISEEQKKLAVKKPFLTTQGAWDERNDGIKSQIKLLEKDETDLEKKIREAKARREDPVFDIPYNSSEGAYGIVRQQTFTGTVIEIFRKIEKELVKLRDRKMPEDIVEARKKVADIKAALQT